MSDRVYDALTLLLSEHANFNAHSAESVTSEAEYIARMDWAPPEIALATAITARLSIGRYVQ